MRSSICILYSLRCDHLQAIIAGTIAVASLITLSDLPKRFKGTASCNLLPLVRESASDVAITFKFMRICWLLFSLVN